MLVHTITTGPCEGGSRGGESFGAWALKGPVGYHKIISLLLYIFAVQFNCYTSLQHSFLGAAPPKPPRDLSHRSLQGPSWLLTALHNNKQTFHNP